MSNKLEMSLEEITKLGRQTARRGAPRRHLSNPKKANGTVATAPVGGVKKATRAAKPVKGNVPTISTGPKESKVIVSGLPADVGENHIKEYFSKSAGAVKKVVVTYNQHGQSRGIATITFFKPGAATKAAQELNGLLVDGKTMKVEVVLDAAQAPVPAPVKTLSDRVAQPKPQPKPATAIKATSGNARAGVKAGRRGARRGRNANRPKPKTAEELDADMMDYFNDGTGGAATSQGPANGAAVPATGGGEELMDEIS